MADLTTAQTESSKVERPLGKVDQSFYLIGVGASAGGLDAIKQLINQLQPGFTHSLVIVQHISPDYKSLMSEILARETSMPVREVTDNMAVEAGHIYLIPPRSNIVIQGTKGDSADQRSVGANGTEHTGLRFSLVEPTPRPGLNLPIDVFFLSLAEAVEDRAIAVILSGSGSDGSRGLRAIKDHEGLVLVQDPATAAFDGMPRSAMATGIVDILLSPDAIVGEINRYIEMREKGIDNVERIFTKAGNEFSELLSMVSEKAELDFSLYKEPTLKRRVARRMALRGYGNLREYLDHLKRDSSELNVLYREFLVGVTNFFRDLPVWSKLQETVLPTLFKEGHTEEPVRVWSVGCSTGEEAYTIAMLLEEYREAHGITRDFRVFATDVNENAITAAKQAIYPDTVREEIPEVYLNKGYLTFQSGTFTISPSIRNRVVFSVQNVIDDAPFSRTDLIICRNLLIYLSPDVQAKIMTHFSFSLRQDGFLQLGAAETPGQHGAMFEALVHKSRLYRNTRQIDRANRRNRISLDFPATQFLPRERRMAARSHMPGEDISALLQYTLSDSKTCICITDEVGKVIRTFGDHSDLLNIPTSGFSANLMELIDDRLRSSVALVLRRAETESNARKDGLRLIADDAVEVIDITCRKISWEGQSLAYAVTFQRRAEQALNLSNQTTEAPNMPTKAYIQHLESEVQSLQDMLSATAEDLGASNEELQTTNEELIASNEELQANNEETQSINEELHTLNSENAEKIAELEAATGDINNLLATADLGVLVLDDDLCIRQFSTGINRYLELEASDVGRPLSNFAVKLEADSLTRLMDDVRLSRELGEESTRELNASDGGYAFCRVRPYRNVHGNRNGVVVTLQDVTDVKILEQEVREQRDRLESLLEGKNAGYSDMNLAEDKVFFSPRFLAILGYAQGELGTTIDDMRKLVHPEDQHLLDIDVGRDPEQRGRIPETSEKRFIRKDGAVIWMHSRNRVTDWSADKLPLRKMALHIDVTEIKEREFAVQRRVEDLRRFAYIAAHDLKQPMNTVENCITMLREDLSDEVIAANEQIIGFLSTSVHRMKERVDGILDFARLQDQEIDFVPVDLKEVVDDCLMDLSAQVAESQAEIVVAQNLPTALGASRMILRVIQNIVSNALKYKDPDRTCHITIDPAPAPAGMVALRIADNGIGIPEQYHQKVFQLFARLHTDSEYSGTGIGLALAQQITEQLDGHITITDGVEGGAAFVITLKAG
ncbi:MAG: chemotaxis protein CheB [Pseudomonadota bacterium]